MTKEAPEPCLPPQALLDFVTEQLGRPCHLMPRPTHGGQFTRWVLGHGVFSKGCSGDSRCHCSGNEPNAPIYILEEREVWRKATKADRGWRVVNIPTSNLDQMRRELDPTYPEI